MKILSSEEIRLIRVFLEIPIPKYIREYSDRQFDLMDCYEVGFVFANNLLKNKKINPNLSPWGDGKSVIFDPCYSELLLNILKDNLSKDINNYCRIYLDVLAVFKAHFI